MPQDSETIEAQVTPDAHAIVALANASAELIALAREALLARERVA